MNQEIINLFDEYTHKPLSRSEFMQRLTKLTGGTAAALAVLPLLEVNYSNAVTIAEDDEDIITEEVSFEGDGTVMKAYLAKPKKINGKIGTVLVIHENRGLNPHIKDVTRRVAKAGYIALGVDALSPFGGTPSNEDEARGLFGKLDAQKNLNNFLKGLDYLRSLSSSNGKTACVGFCWGGGMANQLAVNSPKLNAAVAYYGRQAEAVDVPKIKAALQLHYGGLDERVNAGIPAYEAALKSAGIKHEIYIYEGANHAFNNDTAPTRYNPEAAKLAWERTLRLFKETIS
ncbi:dienelactone hydrolase [Emticicia oligotrophica DSM 17448]|uniref:Dienelactone hydrolase n=1 Tax=Emticicia oligotrophica (strain DSM 17448 / CIP 109782 / MTCC 6937 / GPTSA100-15) TaxID=929562 RepID=A0ABM5N5R3_EMTOG|nr:dienelactone hydrolase family protein [Emticicia oligotrophica]AFK04701.1 dienelactone hydrolase [Emticicia oligotrophica DSM 17448]